MKVHLMERGVSLGYLTQSDDKMHWTPNVENIEIMKEKYPFVMDMFFLPSEEKLYDKAPRYYDEFLWASNRADLKKSAGIEDLDNDFERLYKMGKLDFYPDEFTIVSE